MPEVFGGQLEL